MSTLDIDIEVTKWCQSYIKRVPHNYFEGLNFNSREHEKLYSELVELGYRADNPQDFALFCNAGLFERNMKIIVKYQIQPEIAHLIKSSIFYSELFFENLEYADGFIDAAKNVTVEQLEKTLATSLTGSHAILAAFYPNRYAQRLLQAQQLHIPRHWWLLYCSDYELEPVMDVVRQRKFTVDEILGALDIGFSYDEVLLYGAELLKAYGIYGVHGVRSITVDPVKFTKIFMSTSSLRPSHPTIEQIEHAINIGMEKVSDFKQTAKEMGIKPRHVVEHFDAIIEQWEINQMKIV